MTDESAKKRKPVKINVFGRRYGETHHNAKLTDHEVALIRTLRLEHRMRLQDLADKFEISVSTVCDICKFRRRSDGAIEPPENPTNGSSE